MSRTRADLLASYRSYLALQRDLSEHTVRAYLVDINDLLSFLGVGEGDTEPIDAALATLDLADLRDWLPPAGGRRSDPRAQETARSGTRTTTARSEPREEETHAQSAAR